MLYIDHPKDHSLFALGLSGKCCKLQETFTCNLWTQLSISVSFSVVSMRWCMETSGILELFSSDYYKSTACFVITCWIIIKVGQNVARFEILTIKVSAFWPNILLPLQVNQTFLNIWNITYTQTTSTKIQIGLSSRWVEIGFVDIHATHGSHTMPGRFLGNLFKELLDIQRVLGSL